MDGTDDEGLGGSGQPGPEQRRARELSRGRPARPRASDTGRRHHIGAAPAVLPVLREDGSVGTTRSSPVQLADLTETQLERLADRMETEMWRAAAAVDYEEAADRRNDAAAVREELARRRSGG